MKQDVYNSILLSALVADAHCMPLHWNYDKDSIDAILANDNFDIQGYNSGTYSDYFKNKKAGEQTHHGDMILHLYTYLHSHEYNFSLQEYIHAWTDYINSYPYYKDKSSITTLEHIAFNIIPTGADSTDLCGVSTLIPLLHTLSGQTTEVEIEHMLSRVSMTHNNTLTLDTSRWCIYAILHILEGHPITEALEMAKKPINNKVFHEIYNVALKHTESDNSHDEILRAIGLGCGIEVGLPMLLVLLYKNPNPQDYVNFVLQNTCLGADASSRALLGGSFYGACRAQEIPEPLIKGLLAHHTII